MSRPQHTSVKTQQQVAKDKDRYRTSILLLQRLKDVRRAEEEEFNAVSVAFRYTLKKPLGYCASRCAFKNGLLCPRALQVTLGIRPADRKTSLDIGNAMDSAFKLLNETFSLI